MKYSLRSLIGSPRITLRLAAFAMLALGLFFGILLTGLGETVCIVVMAASLLYVMFVACWIIVFASMVAKGIEPQNEVATNPPPNT